ncbi:peptidase inhibitor family I36 protein [Spirillospora sp. CA-142024]|uniref:peptidase inhibitor family I36 protein n=1 Tax=Spirillospora sp. CA-142024 TaxID=3240036 RepID=UPI003D8DD873
MPARKQVLRLLATTAGAAAALATAGPVAADAGTATADTCAPNHFCVYSKTHYRGVKVTYTSKLGCRTLPASVKKHAWSYQNRTNRVAGIGTRSGVHLIPKRGHRGAFNPSTKKSLATSALSACVTACNSTATGQKAAPGSPASRAARAQDVSIMC